MEEPLDYDQLNRIYREEKSNLELQKIEKDFYQELSGYITRLSTEKDESEKKNGADAAKTIMLRDEYKRSKQRADSIIDLRLKKVLDMARVEAHGGKIDSRNLLPQENQIKERFSALLKDWCEGVFGEGCDNRLEPSRDSEGYRNPIVTMTGGAGDGREERIADTPVKFEPSQRPTPTPLKIDETIVVAVLADIPSFAGLDRNYTLKRGDVVTLPVNIGQVLVKGKKVRRIL